jgi:hypothetical protein
MPTQKIDECGVRTVAGCGASRHTTVTRAIRARMAMDIARESSHTSSPAVNWRVA